MALPVAVAGADVTKVQGDLPFDVPLDAVASVPGTGANQITAWAWQILDAPLGGAAVLLNANTQTPTLQGCNVWGNWRLFLVVTDNLAAQSETDPLKAPDSAFIVVRVQSTATGLEKLAAGERNHRNKANAVVAAVDALQGQTDTIAVQDLSDVGAATSTGPHLDHLMDAGWATQNGLEGGVVLHKHPAGGLAPATTAALGGVKLADAPLDPANPKVVTQDRFTLCAFTEGQSSGLVDTGVSAVQWMAHEAFFIVKMTVAMRDGGTIAGGGYEIQLLNDGVFVAGVHTPAPAIDHGPANVKVQANVDVVADKIVSVNITVGPAGAARGKGLSIVLDCRKKL